MDLQMLVNGADRMSRDRNIRRSIGGNDEYRRFSVSPRKAGKRVHRRKITPMQVFEYDHPRSFLGQTLHETAELAKHAFPRSSENLVLECSTILFTEKRRHLSQPGRRVIAKSLEQERAIGAAA